MRAEEIAGALGGLRVAYREQSKGKAGGGACLPLSAVEVLYWIAAGVRTMPELQKVMGAHPSLSAERWASCGGAQGSGLGPGWGARWGWWWGRGIPTGEECSLSSRPMVASW
jgi:hypothetical protein